MVADTSTANSPGKIHASKYLPTALLSAVARSKLNRQRAKIAFRCVVIILPTSIPENFGWAASKFLPVDYGSAVASLQPSFTDPMYCAYSKVCHQRGKQIGAIA